MNFKEKYRRKKFLTFLQHHFLPEDFTVKEESLNIEFRTDFIKKINLLGSVNSLDLKVYEIEHKSEFDPRVSLTRETFRLMASYASKKALVLFVSGKSANYRFSLVTIDLKLRGTRVAREYSNPKRYSFFLGPEAKTHTPENFLIKKGRVKDFADLLSRFNVEVVTKEFYKEYEKLFGKLSDYLKKDHGFEQFAHKNGIDIDSFAKKLLGQIVFIYFLQRKGWIGAKRKAKINEGDKNFLRNLFNRSHKEKANFFNNYLEHLFYDAFNKKPDYAGNFYRDYFDCQIPFLNGGLFEPLNNYDWRESFVHIPNKMFSTNPQHPEKGEGILDIFDLYNFTVYEDDPVDKEVSIDPEMLGKVFENLLKENLRKGKGTYYTPREIVHYMCQESLINYLATESGLDVEEIRKKYFPVFRSLEEEKKLEVKDVEVAKKIIEALKNIKVVDPACGSGAFLVGMLQLITKLRLELEAILSEYAIKKETIQNSVYGVDIDPGAVEIAKLRLWLSLIVDYEVEEIEPLPNLDYKIIVGNSLIDRAIVNGTAVKIFDLSYLEKTEHAVKYKNLFEIEPQEELFASEKKREIKNLVGRFIDKKEQLFKESDLEKKVGLRREINRLENEIIRISLKEELQRIRENLKNNFPEGIRLDGKQAKEILDLEFQEAFLSKLMKDDKELDRYKHENIFLWHLNFIEIFREKGGFDVVIANPPYVDSETMTRDDPVFRDLYTSIYKSASGNWDLFIIFVERGLQILKAGGTISYIVPNKLIAARYAETLRKLLLEKNIKEIRDFSKVDVFKEVAVYPIVFLIQNKNTRDAVVMTSMKSINEIKEQNVILAKIFYKDTDWSRYLAPRAILNLVLKISKFPQLKKHFQKISGTATVSEAYKLKKYIREMGDREKNYKKLCNTGTIDRYLILWGKRKTQYIKTSYLRPIIRDEDIQKVNLQRLDQSKSEKIIVGGMTKELECAYDNGKFLAGKSTTIILDDPHNGLPLKVAITLLNSVLVSFWYKHFFSSLSLSGGYIRISEREIGQIPIPKIMKAQQQKLSKLVDKILVTTADGDYLQNPDKQTKVCDYEKRIDQLVYKLYELSDEEIKVIEGTKN